MTERRRKEQSKSRHTRFIVFIYEALSPYCHSPEKPTELFYNVNMLPIQAEKTVSITTRLMSGNDFECTYNNDKSLSEIQLEHWKEDGSRVKILGFLEKFGGRFEQDIDDEGEEDYEDEEGDGEV
ncbi:hypothetical protein Tco_0804477 [Tanacetum coccineum]|uniref:Uncharacterized protein n=1 Tax=Tanacetum coccineum TaxID=301880 RepID=A0ABQ5A4G2_9ASTR